MNFAVVMQSFEDLVVLERARPPPKILEETLLLIPLSPPAIGDCSPCSSSIIDYFVVVLLDFLLPHTVVIMKHRFLSPKASYFLTQLSYIYGAASRQNLICSMTQDLHEPYSPEKIL